MGQPNFLIDTNAVIDYLGGKLPPERMTFMNDVVNAVPNVSVITKIEVLGYNTEPEAYQLLTDFMQASVVLNLNEAIVNRTIALRKEYKIKIADSIIAATALVNELVLISRNTADFKKIVGLQVFNPHGET
ncbi:hypothetical protein BH24BAC1_BH24BAC1_09080 [soil metagenome]